MEPVDNTLPPIEKPVNQTINPSPPPAPSPSQPKKGFPKMLVVIIVLFLLATSGVAGYVIFRNLNQTNNSQEVACTMEAKICPDGSSVGRTGPNCEFAPCPTVAPDPTANWETYTNTVRGYRVRHPLSFKIIETPNSPTTMEEVSLQKNVIIGPGAQGGETALSGIIISISYFDALDISEEGLKQTYGNQITIVQTVLGDKPAIEIKGEFIKDRYLYITLANGYLRIQATDADRPMDSEKLEQYLPTERAIQEEIDQIFSTFKFTE